MSLACRRFLRELEVHASAVLAGVRNAHAQQCPSCADRLAAAVHQARLLRLRPPVPVELASRDVLEGALERAIVGAESAPGFELLARELAAVPPPMALPWPETRDPGRDLARDLAVSGVVPQWVWLRVREDLRTEVGHRASRRRSMRAMLSMTAVAAAVIAFVLWPGGRGPSVEPEIVMERLSQAPVVDFSPAAALRLGGGR